MIAHTMVAAVMAVLAPEAGAGQDALKPSRPQGTRSSLRDQMDVAGPMILFQSPVIADELEISPKQKEQIEALRGKHKKMREEMRLANGPSLRALRAGIDEGAPARREKTRMIGRECDAQMARILTPAQYKRYWNIAIQVEGPMALTWPQIQDALNLAPTQRETIAQVAEQFQQDRGNLHRVGAAKHSEFLASRRKDADKEARKKALDGFYAENDQFYEQLYRRELRLRAEAERLMLRPLTKNQKKKFEEMKGEPFDFEELRTPGGGYYLPGDAEKYERMKAAKAAK